MADAGTNDFTGPDPQETSRALEALKALTTEILTLRTTMRSQEKELGKMTAAEVSARQEQISKLEALTNAQKVAIDLAADEALSLASAGKATDQLIERVIKQTKLAEKAESLVQSELKSRDALNERIVAATKQEDERRIKGAAIQKLMASPGPSLKGVSKKEGEEGEVVSQMPFPKFITEFTKAFQTSLFVALEKPTTLLGRIQSDLMVMAMEGLPIKMVEGSIGSADEKEGGETGETKSLTGGGDFGTGTPFVKLFTSLSDQITKLVPQFSVFTGRVSKANDDYDRFIGALKNGYDKFKELLTIQGLFSFIMRVASVSVFFAINGIKDLAVNGFGFLKNKIKDIDFERISQKLGVAFNNTSKYLNSFSKTLSEKSDAFGKAMVNFSSNLAKDPIGTIKGTFMKSMKGLSDGFDKMGDGVNKFRDKVFASAGKLASSIGNTIGDMSKSSMNFVKGIGSSISSFASSIGKSLGPLMMGVYRFAASLFMASVQIVAMVIKLGFTLIASVFSFVVPLITAAWTLIGTFVTGALTFISTVILPMVGAALAFVGSIIMAIVTFVSGVIGAIVSFAAALLAPILPFIGAILLVVLIIGVLIFAGYMLYKRFEGFRNIIDMVISGIKAYIEVYAMVYSYIWDWVKTLASMWWDGMMKMVEIVGDIFNWVWDSIKNSAIVKWFMGEEPPKEKSEREKDIERQKERNQQIIAQREKEREVEKRDRAAASQSLTYGGSQGGAGRMSPTTPPSIPQQTAKAGGSATFINTTNAPTTVAGGGGGGGGTVYVPPVRNGNDTVKEMQMASIPRG